MNNLNAPKKFQNEINIEFDNMDLITTALTHSSYANERKADFNERLEFLGDSVLQLVISEYLYLNNPKKPEGYLTKIRSLIVCENSLYQISKKFNVGKYLLLSRGEEITGGRTRMSILADAVEAIIAAIYLDKGFEVAKKFILDSFKEIIDKAGRNEIVLDYKTKLQETLQSSGDVSIVYNLLKFEGPPHRREFFMEVCIDGVSKGQGSGFSKKEAEQSAAKKVLMDRGDIVE